MKFSQPTGVFFLAPGGGFLRSRWTKVLFFVTCSADVWVKNRVCQVVGMSVMSYSLPSTFWKDDRPWLPWRTMETWAFPPASRPVIKLSAAALKKAPRISLGDFQDTHSCYAPSSLAHMCRFCWGDALSIRHYTVLIFVFDINLCQIHTRQPTSWAITAP